MKNNIIRITAVYRHNGVITDYAVCGAVCCILTKNELYNLIQKGYELNNAYIRGNSIVLKSKYGVREYKSSKPIRVKVVDSSKDLISAVELFDFKVRPNMLDSTALDIISEIDNAVAQNNVYKWGKFDTPFGTCGLSELSCGCKTALLTYMCERDKVTLCVNTVSAGANALKCLFDVLSTKGNKYVTLGFFAPSCDYDGEFDNYIFYDVIEKVRMSFVGLFMRYL